MEPHRQRVLRAEGLCSGYGERRIIDSLDIEIPAGKVTVIVGANASGKSTLLKTLSGLLLPTAGTVTLDGRDVSRMNRRRLARQLGLLPQTAVAPEGVTVADLVSRGRYPHRGILGRWTKEDETALNRALVLTRTEELAARHVDELSGGQRQRVWIAMALAQDPDVLLLDEPTTYLDLAHQVEILNVMADLNHMGGTTVVMVLHELNLAARYADHLVVMCNGAVHSLGEPSEVLNETAVREAFGLDSRVLTDPVTGGPLVVPGPRESRANTKKTILEGNET